MRFDHGHGHWFGGPQPPAGHSSGGAPVREESPYDFLDPARVRLWREPDGPMRLTVQDDRSYLDVSVRAAFPRTAPRLYLGLANAAGGNGIIGLVADPQQLDEDSRRCLLEALDRQYFLPLITRVRSLKEEFGTVYMEVDTDRGPRRFTGRGIRDTIQESGRGDILLADVHGNRYCIADWTALDARSRRLLEQVL